MCGILGVYGNIPYAEGDFKKALNLQSNRGPDGSQIICGNNVLLGHSRLSIHDLTNQASQPMIKYDNYILIFNGEIYNFEEIRDELITKHVFQSCSDTEVLLLALIEFGVEKTLELINGMFSFVLYEKSSGEVTVVRDRFGEKPLYYLLDDSGYLVVSSSLYSIIALENKFSINMSAFSNYLHYGYSKGSETILESVKRLSPSNYFTYNIYSRKFYEHCYFNRERNAEPSTDRFDQEWLNKLDECINLSVKNCLKADVKVGCFLSGGIDSSLIASYVAKHTDKLDAFTIGFENSDYDESCTAQIVADHLGLELHKLKLTELDIESLYKDSRWVFDEPFSDASFIAMLALSKFSRKKVTVCLSGDGGDELFSGYNRHTRLEQIYRFSSIIPFRIRLLLSELLVGNSRAINVIKFFCSHFFLRGRKITAFSEKLEKIALMISFSGISDLYFKAVAGFDYSHALGLPEPYKEKIDDLSARNLSNVDLNSYLHEDVLTKVDRCSMQASLEGRAPLLHRDIYALSKNVSDKAHVDKGRQKNALKSLLLKKIPKNILDQPKSGFSVPYKQLVDVYIKNNIDEEFDKLMNLKMIDYKIFSKAYSFALSYYDNKHSDYKFVWKFYNFLIWINNCGSLVDNK